MNTAVLKQSPTEQPQWYESWFDSPHYQALYVHRDVHEAAGFVSRLLERLPLESGANILDLGCGTGRHARQLASHGLRVLGLDLSAESIRLARLHETRDLRFRRQDMRLPFGMETFDAVFNLFTSFGYFEDPAEHLAVVEHIARALKPGGWLVLDYLNVVVAERGLVHEEVIERDGLSFHVARWANAEHLFKQIEIDDGAARRVFVERVAKFTINDFRFLFGICGLRIDATFGDYQLAPWDKNSSPRL